MMAILYFPIKSTGDKLNIKEATIIVWGGLRGALAIALGLIVFAESDQINSTGNKRTGQLVLFHITC